MTGSPRAEPRAVARRRATVLARTFLPVYLVGLTIIVFSPAGDRLRADGPFSWVYTVLEHFRSGSSRGT